MGAVTMKSDDNVKTNDVDAIVIRLAGSRVMDHPGHHPAQVHRARPAGRRAHLAPVHLLAQVRAGVLAMRRAPMAPARRSTPAD